MFSVCFLFVSDFVCFLYVCFCDLYVFSTIHMFFSVIHVLATIATVIFFCTASFMFYAIYGKGGMWDAGMLGSGMCGMLGCMGYWDAGMPGCGMLWQH